MEAPTAMTVLIAPVTATAAAGHVAATGAAKAVVAEVKPAIVVRLAAVPVKPAEAIPEVIPEMIEVELAEVAVLLGIPAN